MVPLKKCQFLGSTNSNCGGKSEWEDLEEYGKGQGLSKGAVNSSVELGCKYGQ